MSRRRNLADFVATEEWQTSLIEDETVTVLVRHQDGWTEVATSQGARGMVPSSYVDDEEE